MNTGIVKVEHATSEGWQAAYSGCTHATYFHSLDWANVWATYTNGHWRPAPLLVSFTDGRSAVIVRSERRTAFDEKPIASLSAPAGTFGGWVSADGLTPEHGELLKRQMLTMPGLVWRVNPFDPVAGCLLHVRGDVRAQDTMAIDLRRGLKDVERRWRQGSMLRAVRRASRERIDIRRGTLPSDWDAYFSLYELSLDRWGQQTTSRYERGLFSLLAARGDAVQLWLATRDGVPVAGAVVLYAQHHAVYWHGAADSAAFAARPVNALMHHLVTDAHARGFWWFDLNPSGDLHGVRRFKESCGALPLPAPLVMTEPPARARREAA